MINSGDGGSFASSSSVQHADTHLQRFLAQTDDPAITDPMFDETRQLFYAEHVMLAAPGSESIAKAQEPPTGCQ